MWKILHFYPDKTHTNTKNRYTRHFSHLLHICQCTGRPGQGAASHPQSDPPAGHWWWSASRRPYRRWQTGPWEAQTEVTVLLHPLVSSLWDKSSISSHSTIAVYEPSAWPVRDAFVLLQDTVVSGDGFGEVCHEGDFHLTQTPLLPRGVDPVGQNYNTIVILTKYLIHNAASAEKISRINVLVKIQEIYLKHFGTKK